MKSTPKGNHARLGRIITNTVKIPSLLVLETGVGQGKVQCRQRRGEAQDIFGGSVHELT